MTDFRSLCARMADELDHYRQLLMDDRREAHALATEARAALAQPPPPTDGEVAELVAALRNDAECAEVEHYDLCNMTAQQMRRAADLLEHLAQPEPQGPTDEELKAAYWEAFKGAAPCGAGESWLAGLRAVACWDRSVIAPDGPAVPDGREPASVTYQPTDKELLELMPETMRDEFAAVSDVYSTATGGQVAPGLFRTVLNTVALEYARAILASWGHPAIEPEERWYPNFADWLEREMPEGTVIGDPLWWASKIATYLQRYGRPAIKPVPQQEVE